MLGIVRCLASRKTKSPRMQSFLIAVRVVKHGFPSTTLEIKMWKFNIPPFKFIGDNPKTTLVLSKFDASDTKITMAHFYSFFYWPLFRPHLSNQFTENIKIDAGIPFFSSVLVKLQVDARERRAKTIHGPPTLIFYDALIRGTELKTRNEFVEKRTKNIEAMNVLKNAVDTFVVALSQRNKHKHHTRRKHANCPFCE
jgi:hypothetical protein